MSENKVSHSYHLLPRYPGIMFLESSVEEIHRMVRIGQWRQLHFSSDHCAWNLLDVLLCVYLLEPCLSGR